MVDAASVGINKCIALTSGSYSDCYKRDIKPNSPSYFRTGLNIFLFTDVWWIIFLVFFFHLSRTISKLQCYLATHIEMISCSLTIRTKRRKKNVFRCISSPIIWIIFSISIEKISVLGVRCCVEKWIRIQRSESYSTTFHGSTMCLSKLKVMMQTVINFEFNSKLC